MDQQILRQMVEFNKTTFDNSFDTMVLLQEQAERTVNMFLEQTTWPTEEGKKVIREWVKVYNKGCDDFRKLVNKNFENVEAFFADVKKPKAAKPEAVKREAAKPELKKTDATKTTTKKVRKTK